MTDCNWQAEIEAWARRGCDVEPPLELREHLSGCPECQQRVDDILRVRRFVAPAPMYSLSEAAFDSIEATLCSEVRKAPLLASPRNARRFGQKMAWGAAALLIGAAAVAAVDGHRTRMPTVTAEQLPASSPLVSVTRIGKARGYATGRTPSDPYQLEDGAIDFDIRRGPGEPPYRVKAGTYVIEAQQAHLRVQVAEGEMVRIVVVRGEARAKSGDGPSKLFVAGQSHEPARSVTAAVEPQLLVHEVASSPSTREATDRIVSDEEFAGAYRLYRSGQSRQAARAFDALLSRGHLDALRRCDALFWSAQSQMRSGNAPLAELRSRQLLSQCPKGLRAGDAALLLGEFAERRKDLAAARRYYDLAMGAAQPATRERARTALLRVRVP